MYSGIEQLVTTMEIETTRHVLLGHFNGILSVTGVQGAWELEALARMASMLVTHHRGNSYNWVRVGSREGSESQGRLLLAVRAAQETAAETLQPVRGLACYGISPVSYHPCNVHLVRGGAGWLHRLEQTRVDDGGLLRVLDGTGLGSSGLESPDNVQGLLVSDLAEDDVAAIEPRGHDGGDEELGAVAARDGGLAIKVMEGFPGEKRFLLEPQNVQEELTC